jgi:hypothetical protein
MSTFVVSKLIHMISNYMLTLTSISQWALFLGIAAIFFGWAEKREKVVLVGQVVFVLLGLMAIWILLSDMIHVPEVTNGVIPKQLKVLAYFKGVVLFTVLAVVSLLLKIFKLRFQKASIYVLLFFALALFFMVFNLQQMSN